MVRAQATMVNPRVARISPPEVTPKSRRTPSVWCISHSVRSWDRSLGPLHGDVSPSLLLLSHLVHFRILNQFWLSHTRGVLP